MPLIAYEYRVLQQAEPVSESASWAIIALTTTADAFRIKPEVHVGWCPPGTSNPVDPPLVDRSVRFRHTSATLADQVQECQSPASEFIPMSPSKPPRNEQYQSWKEAKRQARERVGTPPPTRREETRRKKSLKHKKRAIEEAAEPA